MTEKVNSSPEWIGQDREEQAVGKSAAESKALDRLKERSSREERDTSSQEKLLGIIV